jgi:hypothetical protein
VLDGRKKLYLWPSEPLHPCVAGIDNNIVRCSWSKSVQAAT